LKPERWGSLLVQEEYQEEMPVTRDIHNNNNNNSSNNNNNNSNNNRGDLEYFKVIQKIRNIPGKHEAKNSRKQPYWALHTLFGMY
jgi:hypothetical protein